MTAVVELSADDAEAVRSLYLDHPGWADRSLEDVERALEHTSLALGVRDPTPSGEASPRLVAAARVLTDFTYYAKVYDVVVAADRRGEGIGRTLLAAIADHDRLAGMANRHLELVCREGLVPFYRACGFEVFDTTVEVDGREEAYVQMTYPYEG